MLRNVAKHGGEIGVCGRCTDARAIADAELSEAIHRSSLEQLVEWADKTLVF